MIKTSVELKEICQFCSLGIQLVSILMRVLILGASSSLWEQSDWILKYSFQYVFTGLSTDVWDKVPMDSVEDALIKGVLKDYPSSDSLDKSYLGSYFFKTLPHWCITLNFRINLMSFIFIFSRGFLHILCVHMTNRITVSIFTWATDQIAIQYLYFMRTLLFER